MDKEAVKNNLIASGLLNKYDRSAKPWKEAFEAYNKEHGTKLDMGCNRCIGMVQEWIRK